MFPNPQASRSHEEVFHDACEEDDYEVSPAHEDPETAHGLKRKMMSNESLFKRNANLPKIPKVELPRSGSNLKASVTWLAHTPSRS